MVGEEPGDSLSLSSTSQGEDDCETIQTGGVFQMHLPGGTKHNLLTTQQNENTELYNCFLRN